MTWEETYVHYRLRLRALCEEFALVGRPRSLKEMFDMWRRGLKYTMWEHVLDGLRYDPMRNKKWSNIELIYAVERLMGYTSGEPMLQEMTFILRDGGNRKANDFRTWNSLGPVYVYAHDELTDHTEWLQADAEFRFYWYGVYRQILPHPDNPGPFVDATWTTSAMDDSELGEEEEEDPEEDYEEEPMEEPIEEPEEEPMEEPAGETNEENMEDPAEPQMDYSSLWRHVHEPSDDSLGYRRTPTPQPVNRTKETPPLEKVIHLDSDTEDRQWEDGNNDAGPSEPRARYSNKGKRMTVRSYLREFMAKRQKGTDQRNPESPPSP